MYELACGEVWGGIRNHKADVRAGAVAASVYSSASDGAEGGDVYYLSLCEGGELTRFAVADVVGHGEVVSPMSGWVYESLQARMNTPEGNAVLHDVNGLACEKGIGALTTAVVAGFHSVSGGFAFASAGHPLPLVLRAGADTWTSLDRPEDAEEGPANLPLGVLPEVAYVQCSGTLQRGDRLFIHTDGVTEAPNADKAQLQTSGLIEILNGVRDAPLADVTPAVVDALSNHTGGPLDHDDVTFLMIEVL